MDFFRKLFPQPQTPEDLFKLGGAEVEKGNFTRAIEYYNAAIRINPRFESAYHAR